MQAEDRAEDGMYISKGTSLRELTAVLLPAWHQHGNAPSFAIYLIVKTVTSHLGI
jgi:hypothetical protein